MKKGETKTALSFISAIFIGIILVFPLHAAEGIGMVQAAIDPPTCTNGDCYGPPVCTNGDCGPPNCTNGDCGDLADCCCIGPNTPGTERVCCCPTPNLDGITCRLSIVLNEPLPEFHSTLAQETISGTRPDGCDELMNKLCDQPEKEVYSCIKQKGKRVCKKVVENACEMLDHICEYQYCGPSWFPVNEPAPDLPTCSWWNNIHDCCN